MFRNQDLPSSDIRLLNLLPKAWWLKCQSKVSANVSKNWACETLCCVRTYTLLADNGPLELQLTVDLRESLEVALADVDLRERELLKMITVAMNDHLMRVPRAPRSCPWCSTADSH